MRKFFISTIILATGFVAGLLSSKTTNHCRNTQPVTTIHKISTDTVVIHDTCHISVKDPVETVNTQYITCYVPVDTTEAQSTVNDSVAVKLPITKKVYADSLYRAVISGVNPHLDSLTIYPIRQYITNSLTQTVQHKVNAKRWGIGITAGAAATPMGISPAISVGVTYNLFTF